jgi:hypothetical protein
MSQSFEAQINSKRENNEMIKMRLKLSRRWKTFARNSIGKNENEI